MLYGSQKLFCPVCPDEFLGTRNKAMAVELLCNDCRFYYFFPPYKTIPTKNVSQKSKENVCKCPSCKSRDAQMNEEL